MKNTFLISTSHLANGVWFKDDDDFRTGMNYVAVIAFQTGISVLAFILMSNHVHFVVRCTRAEAEAFIIKYKTAFGKYLYNKYGVSDVLRRNTVDIRELPLEEESVERGIAYTQMNPVAANICASPELFAWGTGATFFKTIRSEGKQLSELSLRKQQRLIHSNTQLPGHYRIGDDGFILPESYVDVKLVERIFRTPKRYNYFLRSSSKARARLEKTGEALPTFRDQSIIQAIPDLCISLFQKRSIPELNRGELGEIVRQIRYRFSADIKQIARIFEKPYSEIAELAEG